MVCSAEAQLLGSKAYVGIGYARQLFNLIFHFSCAVRTTKIFQDINTFYLIGIRHTAGAISQALAAYIAVLLMRMADFAITVSRMTGNVMSVYMSMFVAMVVTATAFVTVCVSVLVAVVVTATAFVTMCVSVFVLVAVVMSAAAFVTMSVIVFFVLMIMSATALVAVCMSVFMFVLMVMATTACVAVCVLVAVVMSATAFVAVRMSVSVFFIFMLMFITTAAIIAMLMGMLFIVMFMIVSATTSIAMSMLRHMSHSFMIMVLAAVTAGAAFRMLAVILYAIDMTVNMTKCSYIAGTVTDIFQIFLHCIYHLSFQVVSLFI